ncbi:uncharacterized protein LOC127654573 [Xyrauchen texanus]|uniref:uncharacterized protein LOC127654573 n=2 Tax=Xyrauchen texanus TaxID=154827 RepID=UPI002241E82F|nr:uncharacterized protein LOC127654573 [Xyrauchen texanus]
MSHEMVNKILIEEYPKMEGVEGWLFYKASGGHGRRKLLAIPPDIDGYTGRLIRSVSGAGKTTMYIVPLQQDLDLTPLPSDATEFQKMPKAACQVCKENMPLHILALHIEDCMESAADDDDVNAYNREDIAKQYMYMDCQNEVQVLSVTNSPPVHPNKESRDCDQDRKECPICCACFPSDEIVLHASLCGESLQDTLNYSSDSCVLHEGSLSMADMSSDDDVLQWLASQVDASKDFKICITRDNLFQRGLIQWQRQKKGSPVNKLNVTFIGEAGIDTGALSKEFLTEMMHGIERRLFEGSGKKGKSLVYSICDLENGFYRTAGEIFSVSLAQGGPAPCFFRNWCYQFLTTGDFDDLQLTKDDLDDLEYALLIERVESATDLTQFTDEIVSCGYTGLLKLDQKDSIIRAIVLHATMRLTPMLQQIRNGMKVYNLLDVIGKHQTLCSNLFVPKEDDDRPDADYIMSILVPELSEKGSPRQARENAIINFLQDFLQDLEITGQNEDQQMCEPLTQEELLSQEGHWNQQTHVSLSVPTVMQWLTGQRHKPLLPSERADFKINLRFEHHCNEKMPGHQICFPLVSACTNTITIPVEHMKTYKEFRDILTVAIRMGRDFGRV